MAIKFVKMTKISSNFIFLDCTYARLFFPRQGIHCWQKKNKKNFPQTAPYIFNFLTITDKPVILGSKLLCMVTNQTF